ncbi:hypothetical protein CGH33_25685 [Vibrio parahaemolyticus]|nr:hypothetical protein CGH60_25150 [Vibrio parahaemolyticus]TOO53510.1 hypothetical protein CGH33_25685 [Vibrio parahaemolyticus]
MKKILVTLIPLTFLLSGCGDPQKSEFMDACTGGNSNDYAHKVCSCAFDKMKDIYGDPDTWESKIRSGSSEDFFRKMQYAAESCR